MSQASLTTEVNVLGKTIRRALTINTDGAVVKDPSLAAAKTGSLSARTDNTTGTLTMSAGHGITTGARLDIYWIKPDGTQGRRYGITVGTVSTNSVPLTNTGSGDNLPAQDTPITAMVPQLETFPVVAADMNALLVSCPAACTAVFRSSVPAVVATATPNGPTDGYIWESTNGASTPFGANVADVYLSHADSSGSQMVSAVAMVN